jgi:hypothetical protein
MFLLVLALVSTHTKCQALAWSLIKANTPKPYSFPQFFMGAHSSIEVEALCYQPEGSRFKTQ